MSDRTNWLVLVTDIAWPSTEPEAEVLARVGGELVLAESGSEEELVGLVSQADAILTCWAQVSSSVVRAGDKLQVIGRYGIGVDNIAVEEATRRGILVTNVPSYCLEEVSDHAMALLLACARRLFRLDKAVRAGEWLSVHGPEMGELWRGIKPIRGQTLGLIGFGLIPRALVPKAKGFGLEVVACDPYVGDDVFQELGAERADFERLLTVTGFDYIVAILKQGVTSQVPHHIFILHQQDCLHTP